MNIPYFSSEHLEEILSYDRLIPALENGFGHREIHTPDRHHHDYSREKDGTGTLLLMPSWEQSGPMGIKLVTVNPDNHRFGLPSIQGIYLLFNPGGTPVALMDARSLTNKRTAAASALASKFLSAEQSRILLMVGTGVLAPELIRAHCAVRSIKKVLVWGRDQKKAQQVTTSLHDEFQAEVVSEISEGVRRADIISVATLSKEPLIQGEWLRPGQHVDLVGSYKPDMREADDEVVQKCKIYIDTEMAQKESGDIAIPLETNIISQQDILGTLFDLCSGQHFSRSPSDITMFKSVGHGLEDLVAADLVLKGRSAS